MTSNSRALSMQAVSDWPGPISGTILARSEPSNSDVIACRRAAIQLTLPRTGLISPLWQRKRDGGEGPRGGEPARREGVGRKTLMDQCQGRDRQRVAQILVKASDLGRQQQALVDDG